MQTEVKGYPKLERVPTHPQRLEELRQDYKSLNMVFIERVREFCEKENMPVRFNRTRQGAYSVVQISLQNGEVYTLHNNGEHAQLNRVR